MGETASDRSRGKRHHFEPALQEAGKERASSMKVLDKILGGDQPKVDEDKVRISCSLWRRFLLMCR